MKTLGFIFMASAAAVAIPGEYAGHPYLFGAMGFVAFAIGFVLMWIVRLFYFN